MTSFCSWDGDKQKKRKETKRGWSAYADHDGPGQGPKRFQPERTGSSLFPATCPTSYNGNAVEYFTWLSAKLDLMLATPLTRVRCSLRNRS